MEAVTFNNPWWLVLILAVVPLTAIALRWFVSMGAWRRWSAVVARSVLVVLVSMMLAGAAAVRSAARFGVVLVVDVSGSVRRFSAPIVQGENLLTPLEAAERLLGRVVGRAWGR